MTCRPTAPSIDHPKPGLHHRAGLALIALFVACGLPACGGSGDDPAPPNVSTTIGPAGGTAPGPNGAQVAVPAGALAQPVVVNVAQSGAGAPALPAGNVALGAMFALTPHGTTFAAPATATVPFDASQLPAGTTPVFMKTNAAQNGWDVVPGASVAGSTMTAPIASFSWVVIVIPTVRPLINVQPTPQSVVAPGVATFSVGVFAPTSSGLITLQWRRNGVDIAGATGSTYTTGPTSVAADDGALYSVVATNLAGSVTSVDALLAVTPGIVAPAITQQPASVGPIVPGAAATFSVVATGTAPTYVWQRSDNAMAPFVTLAGATGPSYTLPVSSVADNGARFQVVVSNAAGTVTCSIATLTVAVAVPPAGGVGKIAAGDGFSFAATAAGVPYSWGSDGAATLGNGPASNSVQTTATPMGTLANVRSMSAGSGHGVAVLGDGTAWVWGYRGYIDCGFGQTYDPPAQIAGVAGVTAASAGAFHTLLLANGVVYSLGCNDQGELGRPGTIAPMTPATAVPGLPTIVAVAAGSGYSLALDGNGFVWAWGKAGVRADFSAPSGAIRSTPMQITGLNGVVAIAAGTDHALALRNNGFVAAWGANGSGQLGDGTTTASGFATSTLLTQGITAIAAGQATSFAVRSDGAVLSWGSNNYGVLGGGPATPFTRATPDLVVGLTNATAVATGTGLLHAVALRSDGSVWAWGANNYGQLGDGTTVARPSPVPVTGLNLN
ncbi:MAG: hypothetical protein ABI460_05415 [Caldimonas sp.]